MTTPDPFDFLKKLWAPMGLPMAGSPFPGMMFPSVDVAEIEKRIADMKSVEGWLSLNLEMVRATIQGMEAQKATVQAFQAVQQGATAAASAAADAAASMANAASAAQQGARADAAGEPADAGADAPRRARRRA